MGGPRTQLSARRLVSFWSSSWAETVLCTNGVCQTITGQAPITTSAPTSTSESASPPTSASSASSRSPSPVSEPTLNPSTSPAMSTSPATLPAPTWAESDTTFLPMSSRTSDYMAISETDTSSVTRFSTLSAVVYSSSRDQTTENTVASRPPGTSTTMTSTSRMSPAPSQAPTDVTTGTRRDIPTWLIILIVGLALLILLFIALGVCCARRRRALSTSPLVNVKHGSCNMSTVRISIVGAPRFANVPLTHVSMADDTKDIDGTPGSQYLNLALREEIKPSLGVDPAAYYASRSTDTPVVHPYPGVFSMYDVSPFQMPCGVPLPRILSMRTILDDRSSPIVFSSTTLPPRSSPLCHIPPDYSAQAKLPDMTYRRIETASYTSPFAPLPDLPTTHAYPSGSQDSVSFPTRPRETTITEDSNTLLLSILNLRALRPTPPQEASNTDRTNSSPRRRAEDGGVRLAGGPPGSDSNEVEEDIQDDTKGRSSLVSWCSSDVHSDETLPPEYASHRTESGLRLSEYGATSMINSSNYQFGR